MKYKTVFVFDWDGVLLNTLPSSQRILRILAKEFNVSLPPEDDMEKYKRIWGRGGYNMIREWFAGCDYDLVHQKWREMEKNTKIDLIKGAKETIQELKRRGDIVGLVTNRSSKGLKQFDHLWKPLDFDFIQNSEYTFKNWLSSYLNPLQRHMVTRNFKPNSGCFEPFLNWLKKKKIKPKRIFYIGDTVQDFEAVNDPNLYNYDIEFIGVLTGPIKTRREWYQMTGSRFLILRSVADLPRWLKDKEKEEKFNFKIKLF